MKNLFLTMTAGLILLTGCSKEESYEPVEEQTIDTVYVLKQIDGTTTMETIQLDGQTGVDYTYTEDNPNENGFTNGLYRSTSRETTVISWSGFTDETGNYGNAALQMSTPSYSLHFMLETECVRVDGDAAVYGGIITRVVQSSGNPPSFGVNWRFYFKVIDSEQGRDINYDQISNTMFFASPRSMSLCDVYLPGHKIWSSQPYADVLEPAYEDVLEPGFVEVSNHPE